MARELGEVASFKRKNQIELVDMLRGARVARILKNYGAGIPELDRFLSTAFSRASQKGYTPETLVAQISTLNSLEEKYGASFDELKAQYESVGKEIKAKQLEKSRVIGEIAHLKRQRSEAMSQNQVIEGKLEEYARTKEALHSLGFNVDDLVAVKDFLVAIRAQRFDPVEVISKLNSVGELEKERERLEQETKIANDELHWKKALLSELRKLQDTNLSVEQIESIQKIVVRISADRGIDKSKAYAQFEEDIIKNYDSVFGIRSVLAGLQDSEKKLVTETDRIKQQLAEEEAAQSEKLRKIEEKYAKISREIDAYNNLKEMGVDAKRILGWHEIMDSSGLDYATVESNLKNHLSLKNLEKELNQKIEGLTSEAAALKETVAELTREKEKMESSIKALSESAISGINSASSKILSSISEMNEKVVSDFAVMSAERGRTLDDFSTSYKEGIKKTVEESREDLKKTVSQLNTSVEDFTVQVKKAIDEASPQIKNFSAALEAGEKLGKYKNILPLLELLDEKNVGETEALIAMWNVSNRFSAWVAEHYRNSPKAEISGSLSKLIESINEELQKINR